MLNSQLVIPFSDVQEIEKKMTALVIPNAIGIVTGKERVSCSLVTRSSATKLTWAAYIRVTDLARFHFRRSNEHLAYRTPRCSHGSFGCSQQRLATPVDCRYRNSTRHHRSPLD